jgi:hypothetical protein
MEVERMAAEMSAKNGGCVYRKSLRRRKSFASGKGSVEITRKLIETKLLVERAWTDDAMSKLRATEN